MTLQPYALVAALVVDGSRLGPVTGSHAPIPREVLLIVKIQRIYVCYIMQPSGSNESGFQRHLFN